MFERPELKPCPFCGWKDITIEYYKESVKNEFPYWQICCDHCGAATGRCSIEYEFVNEAYEAYTEAIKLVINKWNNRTNE